MKRKKRADAKLGTLPESEQARIEAMCQGMTLYEAVQALGVEGIQVSKTALSRWLGERRTQHFIGRVRRGRERLAEAERELGRDSPDYDGRIMEGIKEYTLDLIAGEEPNPRAVVALGKVILEESKQRRDQERLRLDRERFERETCRLFLEWHKDERAKEIADSGLENEEKIKLMRQTYFADVDALERAGGVELPV